MKSNAYNTIETEQIEKKTTYKIDDRVFIVEPVFKKDKKDIIGIILAKFVVFYGNSTLGTFC